MQVLDQICTASHGLYSALRSTTRLSESNQGVEHFRVWTIGFPYQAVWITPQTDPTGFAVATARAVLPDLVEHFAEIPADRIEVQAQDFSSDRPEDRRLQRAARHFRSSDNQRFA